MTFTLKARVRGGRLILDEPVDLPEGSEIDLVPTVGDDGLSDAEREQLHASLERAAEQFRAGLGISSDDALARLRDPSRQ